MPFVDLTQTVWENFQRKVVLQVKSQNKLILLLRRQREYIMTKAILQKENITLLRMKENTFGVFCRISLVSFLNQSLSLREGLRQAINTGLTGVLPVSQAPQNLFGEVVTDTTR